MKVWISKEERWPDYYVTNYEHISDWGNIEMPVDLFYRFHKARREYNAAIDEVTAMLETLEEK